MVIYHTVMIELVFIVPLPSLACPRRLQCIRCFRAVTSLSSIAANVYGSQYTALGERVAFDIQKQV